MASHSEELPESSGSLSGAKGRKNWTFDETQVLMNLAIAKRELLRGQFKGTDAVSKRDKAWEEIVSAVNAVSVVHRDRQACETRLRCFPHTVKKAVSAEEHENRKTGGGPPAGPTYQPELVQLALNWLDITTLEGCAGGCESTLEPEEEEEVERLRLLHKSTALERRDKLQESIDESAVNLVDSVPSLQKYLKTSKRQPIIVETDEDSTPANTPRKCVISRPRTTTRAMNREGVGQELTVVVDSIDNLTKVVQDSSNNIRLAIRTAARDFMGLQRGATFVDACVGSDIPFKDRKAEVFTQVNPEALAEESPQTEKNERALRNLLKVLGDELPKVNEVSWQHIIGDAMKYNLKNLSEEERNFNVFMDLVGDDGQTEVMKFFEANAPTFLRFSPSDVRFKVMVLFFQYMDVPRTLGLFFSQHHYQRSITDDHSLKEPVLLMYAFDQWTRDTHMTCHIVNVTMAFRRGNGELASDVAAGREAFHIAVNHSELALYLNLTQTTETDYLRYQLHIQCTTPKPSFMLKLPDVSVNLSNSTSVTLDVYSSQYGQQMSPCKEGALELREVCFAEFTDQLVIRENMTGFVATQWRGSTLPGCGNLRKNYNITSEKGVFKVRIDEDGLLHILKPLDYEKLKNVSVSIACQVAGHDTIRHTALVKVVNVNDNPPTIFGVTTVEKQIRNPNAWIKGTNLTSIIIMDLDGEFPIQSINVSIRNDTAEQFLVNAPIFWKYNVFQLNVEFANDYHLTGTQYQFEIVIKDFYIGEDDAIEFCQLSYIVKLSLPIFRMVNIGATLYSRVLISDTPTEGESFELTSSTPKLPLAITPNEGIIFVNSTENLRYHANSEIDITIRYFLNGEKMENVTKITVIGASSPVGNTSGDNRVCDKGCSAYSDHRTCESSCGVGVSTGYCTWRRGCAPNEPKNQYCTCTPEIDTCPDGRCDELEQLVPKLCPFDCTDNGKKQNAKANLFSVCWCPSLTECKCHATADPSDKLIQAIRPASAKSPCGPICLTLAVAGTIAVVVALVVTIILLYKNCRYQVTKETKEKPIGGSAASLSGAAPSDYVDSTEQRMSSGVSQASLDRPQFGVTPQLQIDQKWEVPRKNIKLNKTLGEGEFGRVVRAEAFDLDNNGETKTVAVKMLKELATGSELRDLLSEYNLLKDVGHTNVIKLLGVCSKGGPFFLIVEYCEFGALRSFLRECRFNESFYTDQQRAAQAEENDESSEHEKSVSANDLLSFAWQIVKGMQYLSSMKLVHRDLAARNVLVASGKVIKISDFGLSRDIYEEDTYLKRSKGRIPVKWMAPESLYEQIYTTKSDVWSFGITLWEIVTLGATPYPGLAPERLYHRLKSGYRMEKPTHCSDQLFRVMSWCWRSLPGDRPTFAQLAETLEAMLKQNVEYLELGGAMDRNPILEDDNMVIEEQQNDQEPGYGSISRLTEDNAYLNPSNHGPHDFDDVICDDCTMRMIKEGDVTTECTKLLNCENDTVNNNNSANNPNNKGGSGGGGTRPLLYIQLHHENSDEEHEHIPPSEVEVV